MTAQLDDVVTNLERFRDRNKLLLKISYEKRKLFESHQHLEDLKPLEVFQKLLSNTVMQKKSKKK